MLSYLFGTRQANQTSNQALHAPAEKTEPSDQVISELKAEINELREQITQLTTLLKCNQLESKSENQIEHKQISTPANAAMAGVQTLPTYMELAAQFGEFELHRHYYHHHKLLDQQQLQNKTQDKMQDEQQKRTCLQTLEKIYYFEYLKRVMAIREETPRTICDFYDALYPEVLDQWMAKNSMVPSSYFSGKVHTFVLLSRYCKDVDFIEANLSNMSLDGLRDNPALNLAFFAKHKIHIEAPQIFSHDVSQEYCEQALAGMCADDFERLAYNPRAPVAFMLANADKVNWQIASQFNSIELLNAAPAHVLPEMQKINLNLPSTPKCDRDLQYAMLNSLTRFDSLRDSQLVINYNCDWRQKLLHAQPGAFADWKKYIFYSGNCLNTEPYISTLEVDKPRIQDEQQMGTWRRDNRTSEAFNSNRIPASMLLYQTCGVDKLLCLK